MDTKWSRGTNIKGQNREEGQDAERELDGLGVKLGLPARGVLVGRESCGKSGGKEKARNANTKNPEWEERGGGGAQMTQWNLEFSAGAKV